jgi:cellulose synthase/poly-beta-1,6-N-acetylglucosamine synthase-like glycosyltransferase
LTINPIPNLKLQQKILMLKTFAWIIAAIPLVPLTYFTLEVLCGLIPSRRKTAPKTSAKATILIPAHNESLGIAETIRQLASASPAGTRLLVVADNCSDDTAEVARKAGAEVIERQDANNRGKGFALAFGRDHLMFDPPDVVIVVDADCRLAPGSTEALCAAIAANGRPAQAVDLIEAESGVSPMVQVSSFSILVKNLIRLRAINRLGGCAFLCGTGMAFPWKLFAQAELATGNVVEDLGLAITMIRSGLRPQLVEAATVTSRPAGKEESIAQRSRWEHGFLATAVQQAAPTLMSGLLRFRRAEIALGMHLLVPPLALLLLFSGVMLVLLAVIGLLSGYWLAAWALGSVLAAAVGATLLAWIFYGRETLSATALLQIPLYILWKIPIYLRFLRKPETSWVRTRREGET